MKQLLFISNYFDSLLVFRKKLISKIKMKQ